MNKAHREQAPHLLAFAFHISKDGLSFKRGGEELVVLSEVLWLNNEHKLNKGIIKSVGTSWENNPEIGVRSSVKGRICFNVATKTKLHVRMEPFRRCRGESVPHGGQRVHVSENSVVVRDGDHSFILQRRSSELAMSM